jgi:hypothetical protein
VHACTHAHVAESKPYFYDNNFLAWRESTVMKKIPSIPSASDLETLTTHELADLLGTIVLLLCRLPDVPIAELADGQQPPTREPIHGATGLLEKFRAAKPAPHTNLMPDWLEET